MVRFGYGSVRIWFGSGTVRFSCVMVRGWKQKPMNINAEDPNLLSTLTSFCLSYSHVHLSPCLSTCLSVCLSGGVFLFPCLFVGLCAVGWYISVCLFPRLSVLYVCLLVCVYECLFVCTIYVSLLVSVWYAVCAVFLVCLSAISHFSYSVCQFMCWSSSYSPVYLLVFWLVYLFSCLSLSVFSCLFSSLCTCLPVCLPVRLPVGLCLLCALL